MELSKQMIVIDDIPMFDSSEYDTEKAIKDAIADRKAGVGFIAAGESIKRLKKTIERVAGHEI